MNDLQPVFIREEIIRAIRNFFEEKKFHEVITPTLNEALPLESNIVAFSTMWETASVKKELYLSTSPESGLKKMLARGMGNCFAFGKSFRNLEGAGSLHTPEFLMLEWYRENADYTHIMKDVQDLIIYVKTRIDIYLHREKSDKLTYNNRTVDLNTNWPRLSLVDLFDEYAHLKFTDILDEDTLFRKAKEKGYKTENTSWNEVYDQIFVNEIEMKLPVTPFFITDFPARTSPLCTVKKSNPQLAERFEFYMFGIELGNGNTENTDTNYVRTLFLKEKKYREQKGIINPPIDEEFLTALEKMSSKKYAGIGLGVDRLSMIISNRELILL